MILLQYGNFTKFRVREFEVSIASSYRAMHFSAKRGIAIACRLSVRL